MEKEFNLIDEPWIVVRTKDCVVREVSLKDALLNSHKYTELAGETKTQDLALLRLMLAVLYTVFSRYDADGNEIELADDLDFPVDNWETIWQNKQLPAEPIEKYFDKWYDRFWLFDEEYPFYQSNAVKGKNVDRKDAKDKLVKIIGSLYESDNKKRLFKDRFGNELYLKYSEAARWLIHANGFDDTAEKNPGPRITWLNKLGIIMLNGRNLFETLMLNFVSYSDVDRGIYISRPSWEFLQHNEEFNREIKVPNNQAELLSLKSRNIYLHKNNGVVYNADISGGDFFEESDVAIENMTIWEKSDKNDKIGFSPRKHDVSQKMWQEFGSIAAFSDNNQMEKTSENGYRIPGIIKWVRYLTDKKILPRDYMVSITTISLGTADTPSHQVVDMFFDNIKFHSSLLLDIGAIWRSEVNKEIEKCEKTAKSVFMLKINLEKTSGFFMDEKNKKEKEKKMRLRGSEAKVQFYDRIDRTFRLWLEELDAESDKYKEYTDKLEDKIFIIARDFGYELVGQTSANAIFGRYKKPENNEKCTSSAQALNLYISSIKKIFNKAGDKK